MICETYDDNAAVADYISDLTAELALMAAWAEHTDLARILEMARLESERLCGRRQEDGAAECASDETAIPQNAPVQFESTNVVLLAAVRGGQK
jgi:hypothetical protein